MFILSSGYYVRATRDHHTSEGTGERIIYSDNTDALCCYCRRSGYCNTNMTTRRHYDVAH